MTATKSSLRKESLHRSTRCQAPKVDLPKQNLMVSIWIANPHQPHALRVARSREELARLIDLKLLPGMPVEAFIQTSDRTVMSYLVKPLHDQIPAAFFRRSAALTRKFKTNLFVI